MKRPVRRTRTKWLDYFEDLGWNRFGLHSSKMQSVLVYREVWRINLELLPSQSSRKNVWIKKKNIKYALWTGSGLQFLNRLLFWLHRTMGNLGWKMSARVTSERIMSHTFSLLSLFSIWRLASFKPEQNCTQSRYNQVTLLDPHSIRTYYRQAGPKKWSMYFYLNPLQRAQDCNSKLNPVVLSNNRGFMRRCADSEFFGFYSDSGFKVISFAPRVTPDLRKLKNSNTSETLVFCFLKTLRCWWLFCWSLRILLLICILILISALHKLSPI